MTFNIKRFKLKNMLLILGIAIAYCSCIKLDHSSETRDGDSPTTTRSQWLKSPDAIIRTITHSWNLTISEDEEWQYVKSVHGTLGGTLVANRTAIVKEPNPLYTMALDNLSGWLGTKLVNKQAEVSTTGGQYIFEGLGFAASDDQDCFANDEIPWCDYLDGVQVNSLTANGLDPANLPLEWRKRIMHNIQDIGEFLLIPVDNTIQVPEAGIHLAQFMFDQAFLPTFSGQPATEELEQEAWSNVIRSILLSGVFYLEVNVIPGA